MRYCSKSLRKNSSKLGFVTMFLQVYKYFFCSTLLWDSCCDFQYFLYTVFLFICLVSNCAHLLGGSKNVLPLVLIEWRRNHLRNCTHFRHPTGEQLRLIDTSSNKNMPSVPLNCLQRSSIESARSPKSTYTGDESC